MTRKRISLLSDARSVVQKYPGPGLLALNKKDVFFIPFEPNTSIENVKYFQTTRIKPYYKSKFFFQNFEIVVIDHKAILFHIFLFLRYCGGEKKGKTFLGWLERRLSVLPFQNMVFMKKRKM